VLAHPERYVYMIPDDYHRLMRRDVQLQLNLASLSGLYGREARMKAFWLLKKGYYQRAGSDLHRLQPIIDAFDKKILNSEMVNAVEEVMWR
jgi:tyrosine-protein phosphatase YwqE